MKISYNLLILIFICLPLNIVIAAVDESNYMKDKVPVGGGELAVLVNKDTKKVEYFRDADKADWVAADKSKIDLQKQYDDRNKIRMDRGFKESQEELDRFEEDSMKGWIYDRPK